MIDGKARERAKKRIYAEGKTVREWADERGFPYHIVSNVLRGINLGNYGKGHDVAVALGLKETERAAA